jgi:hypothetical protein
MTRPDLKELIDQLRDPTRVYAVRGDAEAARKLADLLEHALAGEAPPSTVDFLEAAAVKLLHASHLAS